MYNGREDIIDADVGGANRHDCITARLSTLHDGRTRTAVHGGHLCVVTQVDGGSCRALAWQCEREEERERERERERARESARAMPDLEDLSRR
jgi:hypothetical protein